MALTPLIHVLAAVTSLITPTEHLPEHLMVEGPDQTIFATASEDVMLKCSVDSRLPADKIEQVTWKKKDGDALVLLFQDNKTFPDASHKNYQGRAELFVTEIPNGNFSLKLKNVRMEDKGEFICEIHTRNMSTRSIVDLQSVGFSLFHISILFFCVAALVLAVGFCVPVCNQLRKKVTTRKDLVMHGSLIFTPNICMFIAFSLWSTEGFFSEVITCSAVSIIRPVILMKISPILNTLPQCLEKSVASLAFPVYHASITMAACSILYENIIQQHIDPEHLAAVLAVITMVAVTSAVVLAGYGLRMQATVCLKIYNAALFGLFVCESSKKLDYTYQITSELVPLIPGLVIVLSIQRHCFQEKTFGRLHIVLSSVIMMVLSLAETGFYILISVTMRNFARAWMLPFEAVLYMVVWVAVVFLLRCDAWRSRRCYRQWKGTGYWCCTIIAALLLTACGATCMHYVNILMDNNKDRAGYMNSIALMHVLAAVSLFKHPKKLPDALHVVIYMFAAVFIVIINSMSLASELIMKSEKGARTIEDLRLIVLPLETVLVSGWLALQIYDAWLGSSYRSRLSADHVGTGYKNDQELQLMPKAWSS